MSINFEMKKMLLYEVSLLHVVNSQNGRGFPRIDFISWFSGICLGASRIEYEFAK